MGPADPADPVWADPVVLADQVWVVPVDPVGRVDPVKVKARVRASR